MLRPRTDLPLSQDASSRFLPWIIAAMIYLATLAIAGAMGLNSAVSRWDRGLSDTLTVEVAPVAGTQGGEVEQRVERALARLRETPGVARAERLQHEQVAGLLEPWLGAGAAVRDLPLPALIDVALAEGARADAAALEDRLRGIPGVSVDDHGLWLNRLVTLARSVEVVAVFIVTLIGAGAVATIVFATRIGLALHNNVIEVLHLIGARDTYVARQFQYHALATTLRGGIAGLALAAATILGLGIVAGEVEGMMLPTVRLGTEEWVMLALVPVAAALIAMLTARVTVLRTLARMP